VRVASFFAGIGGFDLGLERAGMSVVFQCEIDSYAQKILRKHWPDIPLHDDITTLNSTDIPSADLWCAGWPCQDLSNGQSDRKGLSGARSGLFHTFVELVEQVKPTWLVMENVPGLISAEQGTALEVVADSLEEIGYLGGWLSCNTRHAGLPQNRDRVFLIASLGTDCAHKVIINRGELSGDSSSRIQERKNSKARPKISISSIADTPTVVQRRGGFGYTQARSISPTIRAQTGRHQGGHSDRPILCGQKFDLERMRETDGVPPRLDGRRGRLIGNAVSPKIAEWIGRIISKQADATIEEVA